MQWLPDKSLQIWISCGFSETAYGYAMTCSKVYQSVKKLYLEIEKTNLSEKFQSLLTFQNVDTAHLNRDTVESNLSAPGIQKHQDL